jgi:DNA-binding NtrC family response regulator
MSAVSKTVLIIDDEIFIRQSFADYFEDHLWFTLQAESAEQALQLLETETPQGAIVDIRLGGMDGDAFIREAHQKKPDMVFVVCTGSPEYDVPHDLLQLPSVSSRIFRKPVVDMAEVKQELSRLLTSIQTGKDQFDGR